MTAHLTGGGPFALAKFSDFGNVPNRFARKPVVEFSQADQRLMTKAIERAKEVQGSVCVRLETTGQLVRIRYGGRYARQSQNLPAASPYAGSADYLQEISGLRRECST